MSMVVGGMSGTGALDPRPVAHLERRRRQDRTIVHRLWNRAVSVMLTAARAGVVSCHRENCENVNRNNRLDSSQRRTVSLTGCTSRTHAALSQNGSRTNGSPGQAPKYLLITYCPQSDRATGVGWAEDPCWWVRIHGNRSSDGSGMVSQIRSPSLKMLITWFTQQTGIFSRNSQIEISPCVDSSPTICAHEI